MKKIFIIAAASLAFWACDNNEDTPVAVKITATIGDSTPTRAVDSIWAKGDQIGISSTVGGIAAPYTNVKYTTEDGLGNFEGKTLFFYKPMILTAYYPFTGEEGNAPGTNGIIESNTRIDNQKPKKQPDIDFLWDSQSGFTAAEPNINFKFSHRMSKVTFTFQSSDAVVIDGITIAGPVEVSDMVNYTLNGLVLDGTFNTATGECSVKSGVAAESLSVDVENVKDNVAVLPLIIFPQTLNGGTALLDIYTDELTNPSVLQHYKCNLGFSNGEIKPGYHYKYTIRVTKMGLIIGKMTVEPWVEEKRHTTATIDG